MVSQVINRTLLGGWEGREVPGEGAGMIWVHRQACGSQHVGTQTVGPEEVLA